MKLNARMRERVLYHEALIRKQCMPGVEEWAIRARAYMRAKSEIQKRMAFSISAEEAFVEGYRLARSAREDFEAAIEVDT